MRAFGRGLVGVLVGLVVHSEALACSCIETSFAEKLDRADVVFRGREIDRYSVPIRSTGDLYYFQTVTVFEVIEAWRGVHTPTIEVTTSTGTSCGIHRSLGPGEFLVMAQVLGPGRNPMVDVCTKPLPASRIGPTERLLLGTGVRPSRAAFYGWFAGAPFEPTALP